MARQFTTPVVLPADPTTGLQAATKQYVDTGLGNKVDTLGAVTSTFKTANYTLTDSDSVVIFDTSSGNLTATLPTAVGRAGRRFIIKKLGPVTSNSLLLATTSSQTIDGATASLSSVTGAGSLELISDGSNWHTIGAPLQFVAVYTSPANAGTLTVDAPSQTTARVSTGVAGFTLAVPTGGADGQPLNVEITPSVSFSLTINASILLTTGITSPIAVAANKKLFLGLRYVSSTWYLLASQVQS